MRLLGSARQPGQGAAHTRAPKLQHSPATRMVPPPHGKDPPLCGVVGDAALITDLAAASARKIRPRTSMPILASNISADGMPPRSRHLPIGKSGVSRTGNRSSSFGTSRWWLCFRHLELRLPPTAPQPAVGFAEPRLQLARKYKKMMPQPPPVAISAYQASHMKSWANTSPSQLSQTLFGRWRCRTMRTD